jgi:hypothetical protein
MNGRTNLPVTPNLVTETPELDAMRLVSAGVLPSHVCIVPTSYHEHSNFQETKKREEVYVRVASTVTVLEPVESFLQRTITHVEDDEGFNVCSSAPRNEPVPMCEHGSPFCMEDMTQPHALIVPNKLLSSPPHASSGRRLLSFLRPTPSIQWYELT